jgi:hypothetical protein
MSILQYEAAMNILRISAFDDFKSMINVRVTSTSPDAESATYLLGGNFGALDHSSPADPQYNEDHQESEIQ